MRRPFVGTNGRSGPPPIRRLLWCEKRTGSSIVSPRELRLFTMRLGGRPVEKIVDDIMARLFASSVGLAPIMHDGEKLRQGCGKKRAIHVANRCPNKLHRVSALRHSRHDRRYAASLRPSICPAQETHN